MTLRITLLVLVTGFFAAIWTHDRPALPTGLDSTAEIPQTAKPVGSELSVLSDSIIGQPVSQVQTVIPMPEVPMDEAWMFHDCQMPLPEGIVPGEYRAVSHTGIVREFTLTLNDLKTHQGTNADFVTRDIYESKSDTLRWYFIRVQSETGEILPVIAERGTHITLPAIAERSETKELQKQASRIIVGAGQNIGSRLIHLIGNESPLRISTEAQDRIRL